MSQVEQSSVVEVPIRTAYDQWTLVESIPGFMGDVQAG